MIAPFKKHMGWDFDWASSLSAFNADFNAGFQPNHPADEPLMYNFKDIKAASTDEMPGISVFAMGHDGAVFDTYSTYGRGLDITNAAYAFLDMTPAGRNEPSTGNPVGRGQASRRLLRHVGGRTRSCLARLLALGDRQAPPSSRRCADERGPCARRRGDRPCGSPAQGRRAGSTCRRRAGFTVRQCPGWRWHRRGRRRRPRRRDSDRPRIQAPRWAGHV